MVTNGLGPRQLQFEQKQLVGPDRSADRIESRRLGVRGAADRIRLVRQEVVHQLLNPTAIAIDHLDAIST